MIQDAKRFLELVQRHKTASYDEIMEAKRLQKHLNTLEPKTRAECRLLLQVASLDVLEVFSDRLLAACVASAV